MLVFKIAKARSKYFFGLSSTSSNDDKPINDSIRDVSIHRKIKMKTIRQICYEKYSLLIYCSTAF